MRTLTLRQPIAAATLAAMVVVTALAVLLLTAAIARAVVLPGDILWQKTTVASGSSGFVGLARGPKGVVYAVGARDYKVSGKPSECILLAKYSASGRLLWKRSLAGGVIPNGSDGSGVAVDAAGNATVIGYKGTKTHGGDIVIARYSPAGSLLWTRTYNGPADDTDQAYDVALDRSGNALVAGYANTTSRGADILLLKYAARTGRRLWTYMYNNAAANLDEGANALVLDGAGNAYLTGWSANAGNADGAVPAIKVSATGKQLWEKRLQIGHWGNAIRIALDGAGNVVVGGDCIGPGDDRDLFAAKLRPANGSQVWAAPAMLASHAYDQHLNDMVVGNGHDDIYLVGNSEGAPPMGVIAAYKSTGAPLWDTFYTPDHLYAGSLAWTAVTRDAHDNLYVAGCDSSATTSTFEVGKAAWDGTWPLWQQRIPGSVPGSATPMDALWVGGSTGGVYACGVLTRAGVDYAYIVKLKP
ncbi:MAG TPA: SBBP repeat-containing protein [Thermoleophilia bacterium]